MTNFGTSWIRQRSSALEVRLLGTIDQRRQQRLHAQLEKVNVDNRGFFKMKFPCLICLNFLSNFRNPLKPIKVADFQKNVTYLFFYIW